MAERVYPEVNLPWSELAVWHNFLAGSNGGPLPTRPFGQLSTVRSVKTRSLRSYPEAFLLVFEREPLVEARSSQDYLNWRPHLDVGGGFHYWLRFLLRRLPRNQRK